MDHLALDDVLGADPAELEGDQSAQQAGEIVRIILEAGHCCVSSFSLVAASASHHSINARKMGLVLPWSARAYFAGWADQQVVELSLQLDDFGLGGLSTPLGLSSGGCLLITSLAIPAGDLLDLL